ncbi:MAG: cytochrome ubiquinol oxidase subunit I, partial [bacterium]|nr:cytochrome ubiquinol oxidase subunit I [bacterium]
ALNMNNSARAGSAITPKTKSVSEEERSRIERAIAMDIIERGQVTPPELTEKDYRSLGPIKGRTTGWLLAQLHLWFAAFVLAVPIFVVISEAIGMITGNKRFDRMAYEFLRVSMTAYSFTAISGILFTIALFFFYPGLMKYMSKIFEDSYVFYVLFIFLENAALYSYYYGWKKMRRGTSKKIHLAVGIWLNIMGTLIMITANAWATFMMTPGGVDMAGIFSGGVWAAIDNPLWHPMNLHRFVANIAYGGSIVAAYAAYMFLSAKTRRERAHYDW